MDVLANINALTPLLELTALLLPGLLFRLRRLQVLLGLQRFIEQLDDLCSFDLLGAFCLLLLLLIEQLLLVLVQLVQPVLMVVRVLTIVLFFPGL